MENPRTWHIYLLLDPRTNAVRYVGWSFNVRQRLSAHVSRARTIVSYKAHWIAQLLDVGLRPTLEVIESGQGDWQAAERRWIAYYRGMGAILTNATDGGEGTPGYIPDDLIRQKMSAAQTGRKRTAESIAKTRAALLGRKQSEEHRKKLGLMRKGKAIPKATEAAARKVRGTKQSPEHIEKRIAPHRGRPRYELRKVTDDDVRYIRKVHKKIPQHILAKQFGLGQTAIHQIQHRQTYANVPDDEPT